MIFSGKPRTGKVERNGSGVILEPNLDPSSLLNSVILGKVPGLDFLFKIEIIIVLLFQMAARVRISVRYQGSRYLISFFKWR